MGSLLEVSRSTELEDDDVYQPVPYYLKEASKIVSADDLVNGYVQQIHRQYTLSYNIPMSIIDVLLSYYGHNRITIPVERMPLRVHSCRGYEIPGRGDNRRYHPSKLLISGDHSYRSKNGSTFKENESDWIIFKYDSLYLPKKIGIINSREFRAVKTMRVSIGYRKYCRWKWIPLRTMTVGHNNRFGLVPSGGIDLRWLMNVEQKNECQMFYLREIDHREIIQKSLTHIKVEFIDTHWIPDGAKYAVKRIEMYGIAL